MSPLFGTLVATPKINLCPVPPAVDGLYYHSAADETNFETRDASNQEQRAVRRVVTHLKEEGEREENDPRTC